MSQPLSVKFDVAGQARVAKLRIRECRMIGEHRPVKRLRGSWAVRVPELSGRVRKCLRKCFSNSPCMLLTNN